MKLLFGVGDILKLANIVDAGYQGDVVLGFGAPAPKIQSHPPWIFETELMMSPEVLICCVVLFISGLLCSAGGIGGGGIYVSVLMLAGKLGPHDAVPLSKAVVFFGAFASLCLNMRKKLPWAAEPSSTASGMQSLIDYSICRIVVPSALIGTLLGVMFNRLTADWVLIGILCMILCFMTFMVTKTTHQQYLEEEQSRGLGPASDDNSHLPTAPTTAEMQGRSSLPTFGSQDVKRTRGVLQQQDVWLAGVMLVIIIVCGVLRHHAGLCMDEIEKRSSPAAHEACRHPFVNFFPSVVESMIYSRNMWNVLHALFLAFPTCVCLIVFGYYSKHCVVNEGWTNGMLAKYMTMGVTTGILSGLVGIGGGLIFSPFFLLMGVDPNIAVATSSTCVLFTSSSTTLQYLLTDRIILSLALAYGSVNLVASWLGTSFVHFLQDNFHARKSYISAIVAMGVFISLVLCTVKLYFRITEGPSA